MYFLVFRLLLKTFAHTFFANNYLISSLNRTENTTQYSINSQAGMLHQSTKDFIPPSLWPPNSPDLNPVDYAVRDSGTR